MTKVLIRTWVALSLLTPVAHAEDVYNFYFQKSKKVEEKKEEPVQEEVEVVEEDEVIEVPHDVLLVPDNWKPAKTKTKKYYLKKKAEENSLAAGMEDSDEGRGRRGWSMSIGISTMKLGYDNIYSAEYVQDMYSLSARYHMSRYFDVNGEVLVPDGDAEITGFGTSFESLDPQFNIGLGITPIHLNIFGGELIEMGVDGGVSFGNREYMLGESNTVYFGPRIGLNLGDHFSFIYTGKFDAQNNLKYAINTFSVGYRW